MYKFYNYFYNNISRLIVYYEDIIGIKELRIAQSNVLKTEEKFLDSQNSRRVLQNQINQILLKRNEISVELENTPRGQKRFLQLVTDEHEIIIKENELKALLADAENVERENFSVLSSKLRESHEKEREQTEKTKYWSIGGSLIGAFIGILGASVNNYLRNKEIRHLLNHMDSTNIGSPINQDQMLLAISDLKTDFKQLYEQSHTQPNIMSEKLNHLAVIMEKIGNSRIESTKPFPTVDTNESTENLKHVVIGSSALICFSIAFMILYATITNATDTLF